MIGKQGTGQAPVQEQHEEQPLPVEPGHVMSRERYEQLLREEARQKQVRPAATGLGYNKN